MVDALKGNSSVLKSAANVSATTLRNNFKSLSSGKVSDAANSAAKEVDRVSSSSDGSQDSVANVLAGLNDAVSHSAMALDSIKKVADVGSSIANDPALAGVLKDLEGVGSAVSEVLSALRDRLDHAEVIKENLSASTARLSDLNQAQAQAAETEAQIQYNSQNAVDAHEGLTPDRVARLLME